MLRPERMPEAEPREVDPRERIREHLERLRRDGCFAAFESGAGEAGLRLEGFSSSSSDLARLGEELDRVAGREVDLRPHVVTGDQCEALSFAGRIGINPAATLAIEPKSHTIESGTYVSGLITNFDARHLYLLVVDDEGRVQEISNMFRASEDSVGFIAPMTLSKGPVETVQILLALSSQQSLATVAERDGAPAQDYFAALADEIERTGQRLGIGFTYLYVRQPGEEPEN